MKDIIVITLLAVSLLTGYSVKGIHKSEIAFPDDRGKALSELSSLQDYLQHAALNNPGLEAVFNQWKVSVERTSQATALPDPRFTYSYFIEEVETRVGPQRQKFELSQKIPWFGVLRSKEKITTEAAAAAYQHYERARLKLFYDVKKRYFEYYYLGKAVEITKQNVNLLSELEAVARTRFKTGEEPHSTIIKVQVELGRLKDRLQELESLKKPLVAKLNATLNRPLGSDLPWPNSIDDVSLSLSDEELFTLLRSSSPELKALEHMVKKESSGVTLANRNTFPDIMLGVGLIETGEAEMSGVDESGKDPIIAMIGVNLPIWRGSYRAEIREAQAKKAAAQAKLADRKNSLLADVQLALYHFQDAERKVRLYGNGLIPKARESFEVNKRAFKSGKVKFLDVIDAERMLLEFELSYERALANRAQRLAELEMLVGQELSQHQPSEGEH